MKTVLYVVATCLFASSALAAGSGDTVRIDGPLTYEVFDPTVEHGHLESCPAEFDPDKYRCALTLATDMAHIFVFELDGDQPLVAIKSFDLMEGGLLSY